ncbi:MAG TPA: GH3 auxin-responsive promoter family protein [Saprospiraceae bacterium]|nr:GH3 auxin-responsive promoter family protein [Saprospiraceae bacterium]
MAILGQIIKSAIELGSRLNTEDQSPAQLQEQQLRKLLQKAKATAFGIYYGFEELLEAEDLIQVYQKAIPLFDYQKMNPEWWQQQQKLPNISWPGKPSYFALTSGTTSNKSKRIPVTDDMLSSFRAVGVSQALSLSKFDFPNELFEKEVLLLSSSANLDEHNYGHLEGEISGINSSNLPPWFGGFYRPGKEIAAIDDWDVRVEEIAKEAPNWDIGAIAGIPSWVSMMMEKIIERHQLDTIHDIWPDLQLYLSGGVAFEPYRQTFEKLTAKPLTYLDTYLASEGFFAYTARPDTLHMKLAINHDIFYEFIPFDEDGFDETGNLLEKPKVLTIGQVEEDKDYAMIISTPAGAWRYMIGDTIRFTDLEAMEMRISGRTKYFLNVVGSQLSEDKMNRAIEAVEKEMGIDIKEFSVAAIKDEDDNFYHQWVIGTESKDEAAILEKLDATLKDINKNYGVARSKALKDVKVNTMPTEVIYNWLETKKKKGGQIKIPKIMKAEMMQELLDFAKAQA